MNFRTTIILMALFLLGGGAFLYSRYAAPTGPIPPHTAATKEPILASPPRESDIVSVTVSWPDQSKVVIQRQDRGEKVGGGDWIITEPTVGDADSFAVTSLIDTYLRLVSQATVGAGPESLANYGLQPPQAIVALKDTTGKEYVFELGRQAALRTEAYVRVGGTVHLVDRDLGRELKRDVNEFRNKNALRMNTADVVEAVVEHDQRRYTLAKGPDGDWRITSPIDVPALADKVRPLLSKLVTLRISEFVDTDASAGNRAALGLEQPYVRITLTAEERPGSPPPGTAPASQPQRRTVTLLVGAPADVQTRTRFLIREDQPWLGKTDATTVEGLIPKVDELRDTRVVRLSDADVTKLTLSVAGGEPVTVTRESGLWRGTGDLERVDQEAVRDVLQALVDLTAVQFIDRPESLETYGLAEPRAVVQAAKADGSVITLRVGKETSSGRNTYAQVEGAGGVFVIREAATQRLAVAPLSLRQRDVLTFDPQRLQRLELAGPNRAYVLERGEDNTWKLTQPDAPIDAAAVRELTMDLSGLRARRIVARDQFAEYGLESAPRTIALKLAAVAPTPDAAPPSGDVADAGEREHTLRLAERDGLTYARLDDQPFIFELDPTVAKVLSQELISRQLLKLSVEDLTAIRVSAPGGEVAFARDGKDWIFQTDPTVKISQTAVKETAGILADLRVESYVAYQDADLEKLGLDRAPAKVVVGLKDGSTITLVLDQTAKGELPRLAGWVEQRRAFLLRHGDVEKLMRGLDEYVAPDGPAQPAQPEGIPPGAMPPGAFPPG